MSGVATLAAPPKEVGSPTIPSTAGLWGPERVSDKVLLLLDVNGTLCYRSESRLGGVEEALRFKKRFWYARQGVGKLLRDVSATGYYHVCVLTSMMSSNANRGVRAIVPAEDMGHIHTIFDREYNKRDPEAPKKWDTMRDMQKIWNSLQFTINQKFDVTNTILIDNEPRKFKDTPRNGVVVPEFGAEQAVAGNDVVLETLAKYLVELAGHNPADVRDYLDAKKYTFFIPNEVLGTDRSLAGFTETVKEGQENADFNSNYEANAALDKLLNLPKGTSVHLKRIEGTWAVMKHEKSKTWFKVKCTDGVLIERKMNLQQLIRTVGEKSIALH